MAIKQTASINIENKVFTEDNIIKLLKMVESLKNDEARDYVSLEIKSTDNVSYQIDDGDLDEVRPFLKEKKISSLSATYGQLGGDNRLRVEIQTNGFSGSYITVTSADKNWFNSNRAEFLDYLKSLKPQINFYIEHRRPLLHLARLGTGWLMVMVLLSAVNALAPYFFGDIQPVDNPPQWLEALGSILISPIFFFIFYSVIAYFQGGLFADTLFRKIDKLWPGIELNFGPEHLNNTKAARQAVGYALNVIIIPIALSVILIFLTPR